MTMKLVIEAFRMSHELFSLADAKAHLSELTERAARGETVVITKRGKPVAQIMKPETPRKPVSLARLRELTNDMPEQTESSAELIRRLRDDSRY